MGETWCGIIWLYRVVDSLDKIGPHFCLQSSAVADPVAITGLATHASLAVSIAGADVPRFLFLLVVRSVRQYTT